VKFYSKLIPAIAKEIVSVLMDNGDIEVEPESVEDAREDFAAIIREYQTQEQALTDDARTLLIKRDWPRTKLGEARNIIATQRKLPIGDDGLDYVINQMLEFMLMSSHIEEVFAEDHVMRKRIVTVLRKHMNMDEEVDREVRARLKHLQEGTADWEIQYQKMLEQVRRNKGLI
jgi:hypothetical protein